jgi:hypothetical protein
MGLGRRKYIRHPLNYPVKTRIVQPGPEMADKHILSETENIGAGGVLFTSQHQIPVDSEVEIEMQVEKRRFLLDGNVVRCSRTDDGQYSVAVAFNNASELLKARMMEQVVRIKVFKDRLERRYNVTLEFADVAKEWIKRYSGFFAKHYDV